MYLAPAAGHRPGRSRGGGPGPFPSRSGTRSPEPPSWPSCWPASRWRCLPSPAARKPARRPAIAAWWPVPPACRRQPSAQPCRARPPGVALPCRGTAGPLARRRWHQRSTSGSPPPRRGRHRRSHPERHRRRVRAHGPATAIATTAITITITMVD